jgi:hypothetical protein
MNLGNAYRIPPPFVELAALVDEQGPRKAGLVCKALALATRSGVLTTCCEARQVFVGYRESPVGMAKQKASRCLAAIVRCAVGRRQ